MALKPDPHTAVLLKERVQEVLSNDSLSQPEKRKMEEFERDLERYLE